ncbi:MAG: hypothetical protein JO187_12035 [Acidobacteria bacterium]|nr:hypothetical protein [Acidobacteriota bacterium]
MAVGLLGMMFPHQQHDLVRAVKQGVAFVRPEPQRPRALVMPQPTAAPAAVDTRSKTVQPAARRKHYSNGKSPNFGTIEVGDSTQRRTITPKPTAPTASITVSVGDSRSAQPAN